MHGVYSSMLSVSIRLLFLTSIKGVGGEADFKISKSAPLSLNHQIFSNTEPIYTE